MNIQKICPLSYESKTDKGNTYKKTNANKILMPAAAIATGVASFAFPKNRILRSFSTRGTIEDIFKMTTGKDITKSLKTPLVLAAIALDIGGSYLFGAWLDNFTNKNRAKKADAAALKNATPKA